MTTPTLDAPARRWTPGRVVVALVIVALVAMWGYVLFLAFGPGRQPPPDQLSDPAFGRNAQAVCEAAHDQVATLPPAVQAQSAAERAEIIALANAQFSAMVDDLEPLAPAGEDGDIVAAWIADWRTYLADREAYADALRTDPEARLYVTARDREQITEYLDAFAADNHMPACATPIDV
ncbi:MAG: hypothetical protein ABWZ52_13210 [Acidimicrobiales bacterium]